MDSDWEGYSSDKSRNSSDESQHSGRITASLSSTLACDANGKERALAPKLAKNKLSFGNSSVPDAIVDLEVLEENEGPAEQMREAEDEILDFPMHYASEGNDDDAASSRGSWYDIGTPLPSLPPTPP
ncbi:hypothetical protein BDV93DRAFT_558003 [Ceratobasidium sp. AG-I]|nr:hypothetical protein BDV93DRAFT_558003 [Ceratobasidium sp. AG-I]